jgi:hypothetical protein
VLGVGPTSGHPMGLIRRPIRTLLTQIASRAGSMTDVKGMNGLGLSAYLTFCFNEMTSAIQREKESLYCGVLISLKRDEGRLQPPCFMIVLL